MSDSKGAFFNFTPYLRPRTRSTRRPFSLSLSLSLVRSHARSLARPFGSRRPSACNFAPHLAAPIHRHQYFVIVRDGSGADRQLRCLSPSFVIPSSPAALFRFSREFLDFSEVAPPLSRSVTCSVSGRSFLLSFLPVDLICTFLTRTSRCSAPFRRPLFFAKATGTKETRVRDPA